MYICDIYIYIYIYISKNTNNTPITKFLLSNISKTYYNYIINELETRNISFDSIKLNSKGKSIKIGIKSLIDIIKQII